MSIRGPGRRAAPVALLLLVVGCSSEMSEQTLTGKWGAVDKTGIGPAFKIKSGHPDAKGSEILAASKLLAATSLELKSDGVFSLNYGVNKFDGSWKFDKEAAMVDLTVAKMNGEVADVNKMLTAGYLGVMDRDDGTMRFYPIDRKGYEEAKRRGEKGPEAISVRLRKES